MISNFRRVVNVVFFLGGGVMSRHLNFMCWRYGTLCLFHRHRSRSQDLWRWNRQWVTKTSAHKIHTLGNHTKERIKQITFILITSQPLLKYLNRHCFFNYFHSSLQIQFITFWKHSSSSIEAKNLENRSLSRRAHVYNSNVRDNLPKSPK